MFEKLKKVLSNREIVIKIIVTFAILLVFKVGTYIPIPLVSTTSIRQVIAGNDFLSVLNAFSGGGLSNFSILALGISPYITSSIIVQMLQLVIPKLKEWSEQGEVGKVKTNRVTRYVTIALAMVQALVLIFGLGAKPENVLVDSLIQYKNFYWAFYLYMAVVITAGSAFTMWLADLITRHGIGNGSSMIIAAGIISSVPAMFTTLSNKYLGANVSPANITLFILVIVLYIAMILAVVFFEGSVRKIPVQYANRQASQGSDIPIKLNSANVIPVIFASTLMSIPMTIVGVMGLSTSTSGAAFWINQIFSNTQPIGMAVYVILIVFFSFFYSFMTVDPDKISDNLDKQGAYIPGYRPGEDTKVQLSKMLFRITLIGATYLVIVALIPIIVSTVFQFSSTEASAITIGGTSLIIVVGVAIETFRQIETASETKDYKGFLDE
ncbi:MAG TPA: preprotein translocase subunit SecY [Candidatus Pelethenecus faecipullorum]|uniref:Protein translocase subunit SecY n=1 Tax=Candidatus Pelethenecus faecipullorum TaxID=2840900 RepID=A0A9D1GRM8_9MOLU|nr:preprotein translocase subunit SecY [Candidatus Pelethenecus faecipullorum]